MKRWILPAVLVIALVITGIWGYTQYIKYLEYGTYIDNLYQKSFYELVGHVGNIETRLSKLMISEDPRQYIILLSDIWRQADAAEEDLGELPLAHLSLVKTAKFLNQLGDYCYYLAKKAGESKMISLEEFENLKKLHNNCVSLNNELRTLENKINSGGVKWFEVRSKGAEGMHGASENLVVQQFTKIERESIDYPKLIYDGPFSEALLQKKNIELQGREVCKEEAGEIAIDFIGKDRAGKIIKINEGKGDIETWNVYIQSRKDSGSIYVSVSKKGGRVVSMVADHTNERASLSLEEVKERARNFLEEKGYKDMVATYQQYYDTVSVINFAFMQDGVIVYPDLIKVKVSRGDGEIIGFEARNYLVAHKERNIKEPKILLEEARGLVSPRLEIKGQRLAIIPTESGGEKLCYEFTGEYGGERFIVYIDANNGTEVNILKVIDTENGTMVI